MGGTEPLVRFGAFADSHYAEMVYGDRHCEDSAGKLSACLEAYGGGDLDFLICLGDLIDKADDRDTELGYLTHMRSVLGGFSGDKHWVVGNHDVATLTKSEFLEHCGSGRPAHYSFDVKGVHVVVLDGNCHEDGSDFSAGNFSWDEAWLAPAQLDWLRRDLAAAHDLPTIVFCHENLDHQLWNEALDPHVLRNAEQVREALEAAGNVRAVIQAHYHPGRFTTQNGIPYLSLRAMVVGAGLENNAHAVVSIHTDLRVAVQGFGKQESYMGDAWEVN